jgi:polar amino acid transport system ATP-binding protein
VVTHELGFARRAADDVIFMDTGQIAHRAAAKAFFTGVVPDRVARFLGHIDQ